MSLVISLIILSGLVYGVYHQYGELERKYLRRKQRKENGKIT